MFRNKKYLIVVVVLVLLALYAYLIVPKLFIIYSVSPVSTLSQLISSKNVTGTVYDCSTGDPISGAKVKMIGRGWGLRDNLIVWDKEYLWSDTSDELGHYNINYRIGTTLKAEKEGYLTTTEYTYAGKDINLGLISNAIIDDQRILGPINDCPVPYGY